jgi:hypothetical protein
VSSEPQVESEEKGEEAPSGKAIAASEERPEESNEDSSLAPESTDPKIEAPVESKPQLEPPHSEEVLSEDPILATEENAAMEEESAAAVERSVLHLQQLSKNQS